MRKIPQKCQNIAWCCLDARRLWFLTSDRLETLLIPGPSIQNDRPVLENIMHESAMV